jgi:hypothetical protein
MESLVTELYNASRATTGLTPAALRVANDLRDNLRALVGEGAVVDLDVARAVAKHWVRCTWDQDLFAQPGTGVKLSFDVNFKAAKYQNHEGVLPALAGGYLEYQEPGILAGTWRMFTNRVGGTIWLTNGGTHNDSGYPAASIGAVNSVRAKPWYKWHGNGWNTFVCAPLNVMAGDTLHTPTANARAGTWPAPREGQDGVKVACSLAIATIRVSTALESMILKVFLANTIDPAAEPDADETFATSIALKTFAQLAIA